MMRDAVRVQERDGAGERREERGDESDALGRGGRRRARVEGDDLVEEVAAWDLFHEEDDAAAGLQEAVVARDARVARGERLEQRDLAQGLVGVRAGGEQARGEGDLGDASDA